MPRGKWYCPVCHSKQPKKRTHVRKASKTPAAARDISRDSESSDHPPPRYHLK